MIRIKEFTKLETTLDRFRLELIVFLSGAIVMVLEIVGSRVLAPYVGSSTFTWTSLIGVIMGCLSLGYYWGGRLADKKVSFAQLSLFLMVSGWLVLSLSLVKDHILEYLSGISLDVRWTALLGGLVLFGPVSVSAGLVTPYAVKLKLNSVQTAGAVIGDLYALSTFGSIVGTFAAGYVLIGWFGTAQLLLLLSAILFLLSVYCSLKDLLVLKLTGLVVVGLVSWLTFTTQQANERLGYVDRDTEYSRARIFRSLDAKTLQSVQVLALDKQISSAMFLEQEGLVYEYQKMFHLFKHFVPEAEKTLMIGGSAYAFPRDFLRLYPESTMTVVEIDPGVTKLARQYFKLPQENQRLQIVHQDARVFLNSSQENFDVIFGDAFGSTYTVPYQLTTREAVVAMFDRLAADGVVILNVVAALEGDKAAFYEAEYQTYRSVFPKVTVFQVDDKPATEVQNIILVASKADKFVEMTHSDPDIQKFLDRQHTTPPQPRFILTDDYAPVEQLLQALY